MTGQIADWMAKIEEGQAANSLMKAEEGQIIDHTIAGDGAGDQKVGKQSEEEPERFRKLFIGGLTPDTTAQMLRDFYGKFGTIVDCIQVHDKMTQQSRCFGFVTYSTKAEVGLVLIRYLSFAFRSTKL
jgi:RNA recognition motif-containing protein